MNIQAARSTLEAAVEKARNSTTAGNFLVRGKTLNESVVSRFELVSRMAATVTVDLTTYVDKVANRQFVPYDPSYQSNPSQLLVEELSTIADLATIDALVRNDDVGDDAGGQAIVAMVHTLGLGEDKIIAYRVKGSGIATRRKKWIQLVPRDGIYEPIDDEILVYEPTFDVLTCGEYAYFTTVTLIQTQLNAGGKARDLAKTTLAAATAKVTIQGIEELREAVMDDRTMRLKMAAVARLIAAEPDYVALLTTKNLTDFVKANPNYDIPLADSDGESVLIFDSTPQRRYQIPKLLADDYLHSQLTNRNYEAGSKHRVQ